MDLLFLSRQGREPALDLRLRDLLGKPSVLLTLEVGNNLLAGREQQVHTFDILLHVIG